MSGQQTIGEALREASSFLSAAVIALQRLEPAARAAVARHEAEVLLCAVLSCDRTRLLVSLADPMPDDAWQRLGRMLRDRAGGTPLQYITGEASFYGRTFRVRPGCLIPRPETEVLVEAAVAWLESVTAPVAVADLGTGSGAIAITLALEAKRHAMHPVHAVDISLDALAIARDNAQALRADISLHLGDAFEVMASLPKVSLLVSNPPYIPSLDVTALDAEVRLHEPLRALDGGEDGLDFYRRLSAEGARWFAPGPAALLLEVGQGQARAVCRMFAERTDWAEFTFDTVQDLRGIERVVRGVRPKSGSLLDRMPKSGNLLDGMPKSGSLLDRIKVKK